MRTKAKIIEKPDAIAPTPTPTTVGHGCVDCRFYEYPLQKQPCKGCKRWTNWAPSENYQARLNERARIEKEISDRARKWLK